MDVFFFPPVRIVNVVMNNTAKKARRFRKERLLQANKYYAFPSPAVMRVADLVPRR